MKLLLISLFVAAADHAAASTPPTGVCKAFANDCSSRGLQAQVGKFCSAFLRPQTTTVTVQTGTTIVSKMTSTVMETQTMACRRTQAAMDKRAASKTTPVPLKGKPIDAISKLCSCLVTGPSTSTVTQTQITSTAMTDQVVSTTTITAPASCCTFPPISSVSCPGDDGTYFEAGPNIYEAYCNAAIRYGGGQVSCRSTPYESYESCYEKPFIQEYAEDVYAFHFQDVAGALIPPPPKETAFRPTNGCVDDGKFVCAGFSQNQFEGVVDDLEGFNAAVQRGRKGQVVDGYEPKPVCQM